MAGYYGYSMSNNAVDAYDNGEMPLSQWRKDDIIEAIEDAIDEGEITLQCSLEKLQKTPVKVLRDLCLECTSWHHTSKYYNETSFYSLDVDRVSELTDEFIEEEIIANR